MGGLRQREQAGKCRGRMVVMRGLSASPVIWLICSRKPFQGPLSSLPKDHIRMA